jgi:hypothetical protein
VSKRSKKPSHKEKGLRFADLSHKRKVRIITALRKKGLSDEAIGERLQATKGQIVGFRHRHIPELTGPSRGSVETGATDTPSADPGVHVETPGHAESAPVEETPGADDSTTSSGIGERLGVTDKEVRDAMASQLNEAIRDALPLSVSEPSRIIAPRRVPVEAPEPPLGKCRWPLASGRSVHADTYCWADTLPGEPCCPKHMLELRNPRKKS